MLPSRINDLKEVTKYLRTLKQDEQSRHSIYLLESFASDFDDWLYKHEKIMQIVEECPDCKGTGYEHTRCCNGKDCACGGELILSDRECRECDGIGYKVSK